MRRLLGSKALLFKGKQRQRDPEDQPRTSITMSSSAVQVFVQTEVQSSASDDQQGHEPLPGTSAQVPPSPSGSLNKQLPPGIRVPTHPHPYWHHHTPPSSQSSLESPVTPSHVNWLGGSNTNLSGPSMPMGTSTSLPASASTSAPAPARSSPNLFFPPPPTTAPPPNAARSKMIYPVKSTLSLRGPTQEFFGQQLSPIVEQDYMSPEKRPVSLPSSSHEGSGTRTSTTHMVATPDSPSEGTPESLALPNPIFSLAGGTVPISPGPSYGGAVPFAKKKDEESGDSPRPSPAYSTFISRPLKRSISLSSTKTYQSNHSSATPPIIPPLDLRPAFPGPLLPPHTPTSLTSRAPPDVPGPGDGESVSERRESFITARSTGARESRYSGTLHDQFVDALSRFGTPSTDADRPLHHDSSKSSPQRPPASDPLQEQPSHSVLGAIQSRTLSGTSMHPPARPRPTVLHDHPHRPLVTAPSLQSLTPSVSSSFVDRRFANSDLYLGSSAERGSARQAGQRWISSKDRTDTVKLLFWAGFIAPWCWLIGGWVIEPRHPHHPHSHPHPLDSRSRGGSLLPLWSSKGRSMQSIDTMKVQHGYPFVAPSVASLAPPSYSRVTFAPRPANPVKNPWVRRCRIAAAASGVIIVVAFVVALVVVCRG